MMKKWIEIWKKWFGKPTVSASQPPEPSQEGKPRKERKNQSLLDDLEAYLFSRYDFRFNVLTEQTEYRGKGGWGIRPGGSTRVEYPLYRCT